MMGETLKHVRLFPFSTCLLSLPGRNEVSCSGGDATEDVGVASCEAVSESLCQWELYLYIHKYIHNVLYHVYVYKQVYIN